MLWKLLGQAGKCSASLWETSLYLTQTSISVGFSFVFVFVVSSSVCLIIFQCFSHTAKDA